jgi:hypothetical protein
MIERSAGGRPPVNSDLVEYLIVSIPDVDAAAGVAEAIERLVRQGAIRVLDLVVIQAAAKGGVRVIEPETIPSMAALMEAVGSAGEMLSERDLLLASTALVPGTAAVITVIEDQWAEHLSDAAKRAGGRVIAGERIPRLQVERALAHAEDQQAEE